MRILLGADYHVRSGKLGELTTGFELLAGTLQTAIAEGCQAIFLIGDLWHEKHGVNYEVLTMLRRSLIKMAKKMPVYWIRGNHEVSVKSKAEDSLMVLYEGIHPQLYIVNSTASFQHEGVGIWMVPWYPAEEWIEVMKQVATEAQSSRCRVKILMTHIGLAEGTVSPSNIYTINQRTKLSHLMPDVWDWAFLGDYHVTQYLRKNVLYLGAPIQHTHGDAPDQGLWVWDSLSYGTGTLTNTHLRNAEKLPYYRTYQFSDENDLKMFVESGDNYVRMKVSPDLLGPAKVLHPHARWSVQSTGDIKEANMLGRMEGVREFQVEEILDIWLRQRGLEGNVEYKNTALKYLSEVPRI